MHAGRTPFAIEAHRQARIVYVGQFLRNRREYIIAQRID